RALLIRQANMVSLDSILAGLDVLGTTKARLRGSNHGRALVETALVRLGRLDNLVSLSQLTQWLNPTETRPKSEHGGSKVEDRKPRMEDRGSKIENRGSKIEIRNAVAATLDNGAQVGNTTSVLTAQSPSLSDSLASVSTRELTEATLREI